MKTYISYFFTGLILNYIILFYLGFSAGFSNIFPILALCGATLLLIVVIPVLVFNKKYGCILGLITNLLILPYAILFTIGILSDIFNGSKINFTIITLFIPIMLVLYNLFISSINLKSNNYIIKYSFTQKILLASFPIILFLLYLIFYGKYWSIEMFYI